MSLFYLERINDLRPHLNELRPEKQGCLTWAEFLELLFIHKRSVKPIPTPDVSIIAKANIEGGKNYTIETKNPPNIKYHTIKEKLHGESRRVKRELHRTFSEVMRTKSRPTIHQKPMSINRSMNDLRESNITIPKPFKFSEREESKGKTIRQKKLDEMIEEKMVEEENMLHHQFIANKIPTSTTEPRYEMLKMKREERTNEIKRTSKEMTKAREQPFTFYERDKDFYVQRAQASEQHIPDTMKDIKPFKANPIPPAVSAPLFYKMLEKQNQIRDDRIKKRAQETANKSKLPPRMEMHERVKKQTVDNNTKLKQQQFPFQPEITHITPDFKAQQQNFQKTLEKYKKQKQPTAVVPFNFNEPRQKAGIMTYMDDENIPEIELIDRRPKTAEITALKKPSINPPSTAKMDGLVKLRREQLEAKNNKEIQKKIDDRERKNKNERVILFLLIVKTNCKRIYKR